MKCKKHEYCKFKGKGQHEGCRWHGIIDECTSAMVRAPEYQALFDNGSLAYLDPKTNHVDRTPSEHCNHCYSDSKSSGSFWAGIIVGICILILWKIVFQ